VIVNLPAAFAEAIEGDKVREHRRIARGSSRPPRIKVVQAVAHRAKHRLVVLAVDRDGACGVLDSGRALGERHDRPAA
jgi:hypothetical protein